jgi:hypothetical protein
VVLTLTFPLPSVNDGSIHHGSLTEINHPDRVIYIRVIKDSTRVQGRIRVAIDRTCRVTVHPRVTRVSFVFALVIDETLFLVGNVLD